MVARTQWSSPLTMPIWTSAVEACINGAFYSTGQRCTASSRLIVTSGIHDRFVEAMQARMRSLKIGNALG